MKKQITKKHPEGFIRINISTDGCGGNPYFSITADLCADSTFRDSKIHACGCLHDDILAAQPDLKPFVDLHLSDLNGVPMHAVENGFYWLCKVAGIPQKYEPEQDKETCIKYLCEHLRISKKEVEDIRSKIWVSYAMGRTKEAKQHFSEIVDSMKPRWQSEADAAIQLLKSL